MVCTLIAICALKTCYKILCISWRLTDYSDHHLNVTDVHFFPQQRAKILTIKIAGSGSNIKQERVLRQIEMCKNKWLNRGVVKIDDCTQCSLISYYTFDSIWHSFSSCSYRHNTHRFYFLLRLLHFGLTHLIKYHTTN